MIAVAHQSGCAQFGKIEKKIATGVGTAPLSAVISQARLTNRRCQVSTARASKGATMDSLIKILTKSGLLTKDLDYHLLRASMVIIFLFFGYQKWFEYEAQVLIPHIRNGPLISWMYPVFGIRGASWFLGVSEWLICALLFLGFWDKRLGILGAAGSAVTFISTVTIIPFMPNGWAESAGGFPAMAGNVPFLMKDVVLLAVSVYLLRQDVLRAPRRRQAVTSRQVQMT
ncbi:MAG: YkgB family protein [Xanthobacteraceae bacterium]